MQSIFITADLDIAHASGMHNRLKEVLAETPDGSELTVELDSESATQTAIQLLIAANREAEKRGFTVIHGPHATRFLSTLRAPSGAMRKD